MPTPASGKSCVQQSGTDDVKANESPDLRAQVNPDKTSGSNGKRNVVLFLLGVSTILLAACLVFVKQSLDEIRLELQAVRQNLPVPTGEMTGGPEESEEYTAEEYVEHQSEHQSRGRRLETMGTIAAHSAQTRVAGCVTVDMTSQASDLTITVSGTTCNSLRCPTCYIIDPHATAGTSALILAATSIMKMDASSAMGESSTSYTNSLTSILFINKGAVWQKVGDGTNSYVLGPKSHLKAYAYTGAANVLYFPSKFFFNGLATGTADGSAGTGATLSGAGALRLDSTTQFGGAISAATSSSFNVDFSATSGTFVSPGGTATLSGTTTISGAAILSGTTTFSSNVISTGTAGVDLSASTGLCKVANPWIVR